MKKSLSILLALALALSCGVCAFAAGERAGGLVLELPKVTGIEAEWSGEVLLHTDDYTPSMRFGPENVDITIFYEDGSSEVLSCWEGESGDQWWRIYYVSYQFYYEYNHVFYYEDSNLKAQWREQHGPNNWNAYYDDLPQTTIDSLNPIESKDFMALYIDQQRPLPTLALGEKTEIATIDGEFKFFTFTPAETGYYRFRSSDITAGTPYAVLLGPDFQWATIESFWVAARLEAGKTYYLGATVFGRESAEYSVTASNLSDYKHNLRQIIYRYLLGGWRSQRWRPGYYYEVLFMLERYPIFFTLYYVNFVGS